ncbi:hypothetical protein LAZ67_22000735 [Cordylochernes scorpioides]|uniref:Integrase catalytic domain-containing protein n=1 Tax=Cordylochernes scorpioides TaxID=51811 RepID=A0ABY6LNJ3_9ARAC|nr:hypothetical protein LAZ67_22000735 [Cordylochernes scorpioides]
MEALKKMRSPLRGLMTKKVAEIERIMEDDPTNRIEILALHLQLKRLGQKVEALNGRIGSLLTEEDASEDLFLAEAEGCNAYECMLDTIEVKVQEALESIAAVQQERKGSTSASMEKRICKLPKLELLKFNGTLKEWLPWWGQFERIHQDDSLSGVDKFHYLHQAVTKGSRAQKFLEGYTVTEANYTKAIEALQEKFGDRVLLTEMYVRQLLELIVERASSQRRTLADLYDPLMASLRSLESLGVTADRNAVFLYPMVESSLPEQVLQIWQRRPEAGYQSGDNAGEPGSSQRLGNLLKFIKEEIRGAERLEFVRAGFGRAEKMPEKEIQRRTTPTAAHLLNQGDDESCVFCDMTGHRSRNCSRAKRMTLEQRKQRAAGAKVCFRCLGRRHVARKCRSECKCFTCKGRHVELMCSRRRVEVHEKKTEVKEDNLESPSTSMANQTCSSEVLLMIVSARVASPRGQRIVRILFDSGSQRSYIRRALIGQLNLERIGQGQIQKALFGGGMTRVEKHGIYRIQLENIRKGNKIGIDVLEEKTICGRTTSIPMGQWVEELISHHVELNNEDFQNREIDILIGSDYFGECLTGRMLKLKSGPTAIETMFGWILCGRPSYQEEGLVTTMITALLNQARIEELWDLEVLGIKDADSDKNRKEHDERVRAEFKKTVKRERNGRYIVALPWRENKEELNDNQAIAYGRLVARTKQLYNTRKFEEYDGVLRDWIREDFIEEIPMGINDSKIHYLPHRPVYKPGSLTTPIRPVFDASCKGANGLAINDCLETGPNLSCKRGICAGSLSAEEIEQAERTMVGIIQREAFEPGKTCGKNLRVGVFSDGLLYVESKLLYSEESEHFRRPFLLPHKHPLVDLMIREEHLRNNHAGTHILMSIMREKFWIIKSRKTIGRIVRGCVKCRRFDQRPIKISCAPLPNDRTEPLGIFKVVGIDLAGPLYLKDGSKVWMVLFTCAVYRAIHLEMVSSLETDSFILALSRFIGRRGRPSTIYSDNGTNLVGTRNLFARLKWDKIVKETQEQRISWKLNPPTAAWWGGFWERMIRMIKNLLRKILGHKKLNYEQLETCLIEVESTINKRPLTYITENSDDLIPLTPAMFLQDRTTHFPEIEKITADTFRRKQRGLQQMKRELRQRFRKEYLGLLVQKGKEGSEFTLRIGEIVLIGNEDQKRIDWPMAKIEELIPGRDGKIRVARVKTKRGVLIRPIQKIYPLEVTSEEDIALCAHTKRVGVC